MSASSRLAAVNRNACALRDDGSPVCWGINYQPSGGVWYGQAHPAEGEQFTAISAGPHFTCALRQDGSPHCWGEGYETPEPARTTYEDITDESFVSVSTGWDYSCALRADGTTVCWGNPETETEPESSGRRGDFAREWPPEGERFTAISTGTSNTCGLRADGTAICWGENTNGAAFPPRDERFVAISCGDADTCGLRSDGTFECWGSVTGIPGRNIKPALQPGEQFKAISFGAFHVCALRQDGTPLCWGLDDYGETSPPACWGDNEYGQASPPQGDRFASISSGGNHTCALRADGAAVCWGAALGDKYTSYGYTTVVGFGQSSPPEGERFASISSGAAHTCGLREDGSPVCWGKGFPTST